MKRIRYSGWIIAVGVTLIAMAVPSYGQQLSTLNLSNQSNVDMATIRGFDPATITGPSDPFPDTSNPFPSSGLSTCISSQYGCGVPSGSSGLELLQNCDTGGVLEPPFTVSSCTPLTISRVNELGDAFQRVENGLLSRLSTETPACAALGPANATNRCTEIEYSIFQNVAEKGQVFEMTFSLRSLTDDSGNPIVSQGSYTQTLMEDGVTATCGGTFTFNGDLADANGDARPDGMTLVGPAQQC
ncbi:MAG: hypothetical protein ACOYXU_00485 [Nitrospirota bacterium]